MQTQVKQEKLRQFLADKEMNQALYEVLTDIFTKPKPNADVHEKAASFIALENLNRAWDLIERYKVERSDRVETSHI